MSKSANECLISIPNEFLEFANKVYGEHGTISAPLLQCKLKVSNKMANDIIKALYITDLRP